MEADRNGAEGRDCRHVYFQAGRRLWRLDHAMAGIARAERRKQHVLVGRAVRRRGVPSVGLDAWTAGAFRKEGRGRLMERASARVNGLSVLMDIGRSPSQLIFSELRKIAGGE